MRDFIVIQDLEGNHRLLNPGFVCRGDVDGRSGAVTLHTMDGAQIPLNAKQWDAIKADFIGDIEHDEVPPTAAAAVVTETTTITTNVTQPNPTGAQEQTPHV